MGEHDLNVAVCLHCLGLVKLCPSDCLMKSDMKASSCAAIFRLKIVVLQCVRAVFVVAQLPVACNTVKWERA